MNLVVQVMLSPDSKVATGLTGAQVVTALAGAVTMQDALIALSISVLERRVRGVEVVT